MKIVALSDQHGYLPEVPACDLLIVAGDQCPDIFRRVTARQDPSLQRDWFLRDWRYWLTKQPVGHCIVTWGNHDFCGEAYSASRFDLGPRVTVAVDSLVEYEGLKIWCTPWSNTFMQWAFMRSDAALVKVYAQIPTGLDILVSHQPPHGICDVAVPIIGEGTQFLGSVALKDAIERAQPKIVVCGHIHGGHGHATMPNGTEVYNVAIVNEGYVPVWKPTVL